MKFKSSNNESSQTDMVSFVEGDCSYRYVLSYRLQRHVTGKQQASSKNKQPLPEGPVCSFGQNCAQRQRTASRSEMMCKL